MQRIRFVCIVLAVLCLGGCTPAPSGVRVSKAQTAEAAGLVDVSQSIPDAVLDIRYAGSNNFVGAPIDGYEAPKCLLLEAPANALARVAAALRAENLRLWIFDCYRPVRAVNHFVRWAADPHDERMKGEYYPRVDKSDLLGVYIASKSGHSRGATIDLTLARCTGDDACKPLDMGTPFDFFDERAHTDSPDVTPEQRANRQRLVKAMSQEGFENYAKEWWHYTYRPEPTPTLAYDAPVR
jgi:D-alanyl-D-alanine dipeptidase